MLFIAFEPEFVMFAYIYIDAVYRHRWHILYDANIVFILHFIFIVFFTLLRAIVFNFYFLINDTFDHKFYVETDLHFIFGSFHFIREVYALHKENELFPYSAVDFHLKFEK